MACGDCTGGATFQGDEPRWRGQGECEELLERAMSTERGEFQGGETGAESHEPDVGKLAGSH